VLKFKVNKNKLKRRKFMKWIIVVSRDDYKPMQKFLVPQNLDLKKICEELSNKHKLHTVTLLLESYKSETFSVFRMIWKDGKLIKEFNFPENLHRINTERNKHSWKNLLFDFELNNKN
jgi:predicted metal-dependent phosphoesterase TrpH